MKRRRNNNRTYYIPVSKRRAKQPRYNGIRFEATNEPYTLRWWLDMLGKASHEHNLACMEGDVYNSMRFVLLWGWIQERIIEKYEE